MVESVPQIFRRVAWVGTGLLGLFFVVTQIGKSDGLSPGDSSPPLVLKLSDGRVFDVQKYKGVLLLNIWGSWCPPCREEGPALTRIYYQTRSRGGLVIGVSLDRAPLDAIAQFARKLGMYYPMSVMTLEGIAAFRAAVLPTSYVIAHGTIKEVFVGAVTEQVLLQGMERALGSSSRN